MRTRVTKFLPVLIVVGLAPFAHVYAQGSNPDAPKPTVDAAGPGCIVIQTESKGDRIVGSVFGGDAIFEYLYSNNLNGVKSIDKYQRDLAKWKLNQGPKPEPPYFNLTTLTVWSWAGLRIFPLDRKHTEAEEQAAVAACNAFVAASANGTK